MCLGYSIGRRGAGWVFAKWGVDVCRLYEGGLETSV